MAVKRDEASELKLQPPSMMAPEKLAGALLATIEFQSVVTLSKMATPPAKEGVLELDTDGGTAVFRAIVTLRMAAVLEARASPPPDPHAYGAACPGEGGVPAPPAARFNAKVELVIATAPVSA
jgi:hypothetical protein